MLRVEPSREALDDVFLDGISSQVSGLYVCWCMPFRRGGRRLAALLGADSPEMRVWRRQTRQMQGQRYADYSRQPGQTFVPGPTQHKHAAS